MPGNQHIGLQFLNSLQRIQPLVGESCVKESLYFVKYIILGEGYSLLGDINCDLVGSMSREVNELESVIAHVEG